MPAPNFNFNEAKFRELALYVAAKCAGWVHFGKVKLAKILFFSDFRAFRELGAPITGVTYVKLPHGPCPDGLASILAEIEAAGDGAMKRNLVPGKSDQQRFTANRRADLADFKGAEIAIVDAVLEDVRDMTADQVSRWSHESAGWQGLRIAEVVPYSAAFLPDPIEPEELSDAELDEIRKSLT